MRDDQLKFLTLVGRLPARLTAEQVGWVLNCQEHDVAVLDTSKLLEPLGNPAQNSAKYFSPAEPIELSKDHLWLAKLTNSVSRHWREKNLKKKERLIVGPRD